jgi:hypothetical protein
MLKLFQSIFGAGEAAGRYPESLVEMAIERAVDGTDPRQRALPGYRKRLRAPVIHAIDHVIAIVDSLPAPLPATSGNYAAEPRLTALFASAEHMREVFGSDTMLSEFRDRHPGGEPVTALLLAERVEKNVLGIDLDGETLKREVAQVAVNFRSQRLVDPGLDEGEMRRQLKRRAFDHLLSLALLRITEVQGERVGLNRQRDLLRRKLSALQSGGWSFEDTGGTRADPVPLQAELDDIEAQLTALGMDDRVLSAHLDITVGLLAEAERHFWADEVVLHLDRMNIQRSAQDGTAREIRFQQLHNARGRRLVMLLVTIDPGELPRRVDVVTAAERYLA